MSPVLGIVTSSMDINWTLQGANTWHFAEAELTKSQSAKGRVSFAFQFSNIKEIENNFNWLEKESRVISLLTV